jgi:hypothetical protein
VKLGEHRDDGGAFDGMPVLTRLAVHEWEDSDRVACPESTNRFTAARGDRCDYEIEVTVA